MNMLWLWLLFLIIILVLVSVRVFGSRNEAYWKKRGVKFAEGNKFMGPMMKFIIEDRPLFELFGDLYKKYRNEPAVGFGGFFTPSLFIIDPANIQHVLQNEFNSFSHRGFEPPEGDILSDNILFQNGIRWKVLRQNMTPIFTSAKLKNMYYIIDKSAQDFVEYLKSHPDRLKDDTFDTLSTFCSAAINGAVFGINTESLYDSPFLDMARKIFKQGLILNLKIVMIMVTPLLSKIMGIKLFNEHEKFFIGAIRKVIEERKESKIKMHDFADLCISIQEKGTMIDRNTNYEIEPTVEVLAAQAFFFFVAGVEPTALAAYVTLLELGRNPHYLKLVHEEIDSAFDQHKQLSVEVVSGLEVLDKVYHESLRIHPPISNLSRQCTQDSVLPVGNIRIEKGTKVNLSVFHLQNDEKIFPNADKFDPERWAPGGGANRDMFMPFGKGNRLCIGARYATLQVKAGLVHLLRNYTVKTHTVIPGPPKYKKHPSQVMLMNVKVELIPRNT